MRRCVVLVLACCVLGCGRSKPKDSDETSGDSTPAPPANTGPVTPVSPGPTPPEGKGGTNGTGGVGEPTAGPGAVPSLLIGRWVGVSGPLPNNEPGGIEFRADGTFTSTINETSNGKLTGKTNSGTFRSLGEHRIEIHFAGIESWKNVEVYVSPAELRLVRVGSSFVNNKPVEGQAQQHVFRREGRTGNVPDADRVGGTADDLRKAILGRWLCNLEGGWEFFPDGTVRRFYYPHAGTYKVIDGRTIEVTDPEGQKVIDIVHHKGRARAHMDIKDGPAKGIGGDYKWVRPPAGYDDTDPIKGKPEQLIGGKWVFDDDLAILPKMYTYEFRADGTWQSMARSTRYVESGTYRFLNPTTVELNVQELKSTYAYHITFLKRRLGLHQISSGPNGQYPTAFARPIVLKPTK